MQFFPVLVVGFTASLGLTPLSRQIAMRLGVVDKPNQRKIHKDHKPLMGGLAIFAAFALALLAFNIHRSFSQLGAVMLGATLVAGIGLLDDRYGLGIRIRLIVAALAGCIAAAYGVRFGITGVAILDAALTVFWIVAITNAVNFLDNMDGLAAGLSSIAAAFFLAIALAQGLTVVSSLAAALLGSAVGFLIYNFNPASTFMGDMGALMLGFVLAVLGVKVDMVLGDPGPRWLVPLLVLALPAFDIVLVIFTRLAEGRSPGEAGKDHTSHRLMSLGLSQRQTLFVLYGGCLFFGVAGLALSVTTGPGAWVGALAVIVGVGALYGLMIWIRQTRQLRPSKAAP
jgi:UDP-GlcNAc:undecaprenyl-phosphate GlcNAc-1-phosphate transferase